MTGVDTKALLTERRRDERLLAWLRLVRLVKKARPHVAGPLEGHELTGAQLEVLAVVGLREGLNQQDCAAQLGVTKGNVAQHAANLERRGLIARESEGRNKTLVLTPAGHELVRSVAPAHDEGVRAVLGSLSRTEVRQLSALLRRVERAL